VCVAALAMRVDAVIHVIAAFVFLHILLAARTLPEASIAQQHFNFLVHCVTAFLVLVARDIGMPCNAAATRTEVSLAAAAVGRPGVVAGRHFVCKVAVLTHDKAGVVTSRKVAKLLHHLSRQDMQSNQIFGRDALFTLGIKAAGEFVVADHSCLLHTELDVIETALNAQGRLMVVKFDAGSLRVVATAANAVTSVALA